MLFRLTVTLFFVMLLVLPVAVQDEAKTKIELKTLVELLGKDRSRPEFERLWKSLGGKSEETTYESDRSSFSSWHSKGLSFCFISGKLTVIFMYADGADVYKKYQGELPGKLSFADTRADVEQKLGKPEVSGGNGVIPYWVEYHRLGIHVTYVSKDALDMKNRIHHVGLIPVKKDGK